MLLRCLKSAACIHFVTVASPRPPSGFARMFRDPTCGGRHANPKCRHTPYSDPLLPSLQLGLGRMGWIDLIYPKASYPSYSRKFI